MNAHKIAATFHQDQPLTDLAAELHTINQNIENLTRRANDLQNAIRGKLDDQLGTTTCGPYQVKLAATPRFNPDRAKHFLDDPAHAALRPLVMVPTQTIDTAKLKALAPTLYNACRVTPTPKVTITRDDDPTDSADAT